MLWFKSSVLANGTAEFDPNYQGCLKNCWSGNYVWKVKPRLRHFTPGLIKR